MSSSSRWDVPGYRETWVSKSDLTPKGLRGFGISATQKQIDSLYRHAYCGTIMTHGVDCFGHKHFRHVPVFSVSSLKRMLSRKDGK